MSSTPESQANTYQKYWATMRTNLSLINRSEREDLDYLEVVKAELRDILDNGILSYPQTLEQVGLKPDMSLKERKMALGLRTTPLVHHGRELKFLENMAYKAHDTRKSNWSWRIAEEAVEKQKEKWHPFFVTLTVDPKRTDPKTLWQEGREFRKYIRRLVNVVCKEMGHPPAHKKTKEFDYRPESDYVTYAGVIEHGKSREHHHGHFLIWLRCIPASWRVCPNHGIRNTADRVNNECLPLRTYWTWSTPRLSPAMYFRSLGDIWSTEYNFVLPLKDGQPMKVRVPRVAGNYMMKYLSKEHKEWHHRVKATRNLGMKRLKHLLKMMNPSIVEALSWRPEKSSLNISLMKIHSVPQGLMRLEARRQNFFHKYHHNQLDFKDLITSNTAIFTRMLQSVEGGARPDRMNSSDFYDWVGAHQVVPKEYSEPRLIAAHVEMARYYPPDKMRVNAVKIGANQI